MSYLLFPGVRVLAANMQNSLFLTGGPPIMAAYGLGAAMCHHLGGGARVLGVTMIHHDRQMLGEYFSGVFFPQQRRGAAFTFGKSRAAFDYSSKNPLPQAVSMQPVICAHLRLSIIWELENVQDETGAADFLDRAKLAGGQIAFHGKTVFFDDLEKALQEVKGGYVLRDRRDLLFRRDGKNRAELMIDALGRKPSSGDGSWLAATCVGYAAITPFERRRGAREGLSHAFAEPLTGMVQYCALRSWQQKFDAEDSLWRPRWLGKDGDVFVLQQAFTENSEQ